MLCGFILGSLERQSNKNVIRIFGIKGIYFTAWLGTPVHELGHAVMCLIFGHRVTGIKLLQATAPDGTIGYVTHAYNPDSLYQKTGNFFIGLAPLVSGSLSIFLCTYVLVRDSYRTILDYLIGRQHFSLLDPVTWVTFGQAVRSIFSGLFSWENAANPAFWLFFVLSLCIASHMSLSREDIRGAASGAGTLFLLIGVANTLSRFLDPSLNGQITSLIDRFNFCLLLLLSLAIVFSVIKVLLSGILYLSLRRLNG